MAPIKEKLAWVPNLFTLTNLSMGFFAILISSTRYGDTELLALSSTLIVLATLFDGFDGFAARLLNANSRLGAQLDSLADLVTFGVAPAVLMYSFRFFEINYTISDNFYIPVGMFIAAVWPVCAAYRLARFNISAKDNSFAGLPSPMAGLIVSLMPLVFAEDLFFLPDFILISIYIFCAFMMVSTVRYAKPQVTFLQRFSTERLAMAGLFIISILVFVGWRYGFSYAATGLFTIGLLYLVTGIVSLVIHAIQKYRM